MQNTGNGNNMGTGTGNGMPTIMNQPPQIFGSYNADGSPTTPALPGPVFTEDQLSGNIDDSNDAKRRRIARVCLTL